VSFIRLSSCCRNDSLRRRAKINTAHSTFKPAMSNRGPHAAQFRCSLQWKYPTYWQPVLIFINQNLKF